MDPLNHGPKVWLAGDMDSRVRAVGSVALQHVLDAALEGDGLTRGCCRLVGEGERVLNESLLVDEVRQRVTEAYLRGDEGSAGVEGDQTAQPRRPTGAF